jgi:hypothetical protein
MRRPFSFLFALTALAALALPDFVQPAGAIEYPWCASYGGRGGSVRNCGFVTFAQCMETIHGMGGFCEPNLFYTGPAERPAKRARKRRDD